MKACIFKIFTIVFTNKVILLIINWLLSCVLYACRKTCLLGFLSGIENTEHDSAKHPDSAAVYSYPQTISGPFGAVF